MYETAKIVHLTAMVVWMAGLLLAPILIVEVSRLDERKAAAMALRSWYLRVFSPAMILLWIAGMYIMSTGGWFDQTWMVAKLALVLLLSGLYGAFSGQMRRMAMEDDFTPWPATIPIWGVIVALLIAVISFAVVKF